MINKDSIDLHGSYRMGYSELDIRSLQSDVLRLAGARLRRTVRLTEALVEGGFPFPTFLAMIEAFSAGDCELSARCRSRVNTLLRDVANDAIQEAMVAMKLLEGVHEELSGHKRQRINTLGRRVLRGEGVQILIDRLLDLSTDGYLRKSNS